MQVLVLASPLLKGWRRLLQLLKGAHRIDVETACKLQRMVWDWAQQHAANYTSLKGCWAYQQRTWASGEWFLPGALWRQIGLLEAPAPLRQGRPVWPESLRKPSSGTSLPASLIAVWSARKTRLVIEMPFMSEEVISSADLVLSLRV